MAPKDFTIPDVNAKVTIDGVEYTAKKLRLEQEMGKHHDFDLLLDFNTLGDNFIAKPEEKLQLVHKKVIIKLQNAENRGQAYIFSGMITNVKVVAEGGNNGGILLIGKSITYDLERGRKMRTFSNKELDKILEEVTKESGYIKQDYIKPDWEHPIEFAFQCDETDFGFLSRICSQYSENFYFTGTDLYVGTHPEFDFVKNLKYDEELFGIEICSRLLANEFDSYYYKRDTNETFNVTSSNDVEDANFYLKKFNLNRRY